MVKIFEHSAGEITIINLYKNLIEEDKIPINSYFEKAIKKRIHVIFIIDKSAEILTRNFFLNIAEIINKYSTNIVSANFLGVNSKLKFLFRIYTSYIKRSVLTELFDTKIELEEKFKICLRNNLDEDFQELISLE